MEGTERHVRFKGTIYITTPFHVISGLMVHTGTIPYARDITDLAIGAHTIAVTATGVNGATAAVTEYFTRPGKHIYTHACMDGCSRGAYMTESVLRVHAFVPLAEFLRCTGILNSSVLAIQCNSSKALKDVWCTLDNKETHACKQSSVPPLLQYIADQNAATISLHHMHFLPCSYTCTESAVHVGIVSSKRDLTYAF